MTAPLDHNDDHDFRQLSGAFDRPIAPSPNFADALAKRLKEESAMHHAPTATGTVPSTPISNRTARTTAQRIPKRRWLDIAIAAAVIIGMLASTFWYADVRTGDDGLGDPDATRYAAQPLSAASTPEADTAVTSDPGDTLNYPAGFDPEAEHEIKTLEGLPSVSDYAAVTGDTLVVAAPLESDPEAQLFAVDLTTGSLKWTSPLVATWHFAVSDNRIFGAFWEPQPSTRASYAMMSLSAETGEVLWSGPTMVEFEESSDVVPPGYARDLFRPVIIGDAVYYTNQDGQVIARDAYRGDALWATPIEQSTDQGNPGQIVGDERYIYAANRQNEIRKLDRHTGEEIDRFGVTDRSAPDFVMDIHLQGDTLIVMSHLFEGEFTTSYVDGISASNGEVLWSQRLGLAGTEISLTDEIVAIPRRVSVDELEADVDDVPKEGTYVSMLDMDSGEPVSLYGPSDAEGATVSSSGSVVCINEATLINCVDTDTRTLVQLPYAPGGESFAPLLFWNETAIVLDVDVGVTLLQPTTQPQQASTSGDGEARGGSFGSTSDRSLVNPDLDGPSEPLTLAWTHVVSDPRWTMPYGDIVASLGSSEIAVQDAATGEILWSKSTSEAFKNSTYDTGRDPKLLFGQHQGRPIALPWIEGNTLYYVTTTELVGVSLYTGEETFRVLHTIPAEGAEFELPHFPWDMAVKNGTAYVLTVPAIGYFVLHAIDLETGNIFWSYEMGEPVSGDWSEASAIIHQLVVTGDAVAMQVTNDENSILALDASDGTVLWQQPNALLGNGESIASSNISAVNDQYLALTHRSYPTGATDGTPNADQSLGVALYDIEDGYLLWTAREGTGGWTYPAQGTGACSLIPGSTSTDLYIPCTTDDTVYLFNLPLSGNLTLVGTWETSAPAWANFYDRQAAYLNTGTEILRIDYYSHEMTVVPITGGDTCLGGLPAQYGSFICMTDDGLGTYTLQAYVPTSSIATPVASPAASNVEQDTESGSD